VSILAKILRDKEPEVRARELSTPLRIVESMAREQSKARDFAAALRRYDGQAMRFLCEFKRASPSAGPIAAGVVPDAIVPKYEAGGAAAVSVLTDKKYFDGSLQFLSQAKQCCSLPILRKDFIITPYQVIEARAHGADAILLIASALDSSQLSKLYQCAQEWGMRALIEVHDEDEAARACEVGAEIIGVNHRNLATFEIDLGLTGRLASQLPSDCILVGESGIKKREHVVQLDALGAHALLIGETLMRAQDPELALRQLRGLAQ